MRQKGAVAVFVAFAMIAIMAAVALSIDIGQLYYAQRDLQRLATLSALSAAQIASGCASNGAPNQKDASDEANRVIQANSSGGSAGLSPPTVEVGKVATTTDGTGLRGFKPLSDNDPNIDSVRVTLSRTFTPLVPFIPLPGTNSGTSNNKITLSASATGTQTALGSLRVGSGLASVNGGILNSLLSALLGGNVNLTVANYNGLANVNVTASQLAAALGISVTDLSNPTTLNNTVVLGTALSGLTNALSGGVVNPQVISTLQNLAGQSTNTTPIPLGSILTPVGNVASDVPFVNLQDLVMALALASRANPNGGPTPIQLNGIGLSLPGVASVTAYATVIQPPKLSLLGHAGALNALGTAKASTAQVNLMIRIDGGSLLSALNLINIPLVAQVTANPSLKIGIDVGIAQATAWLATLECPSVANNNGLPVAGPSVNTGIATVTVGTYNNPTAPVTPGSSIPLATVTLLGVPLANLALAISAPVGNTTPTLNSVTQFMQCNRNANFPAVCDDTAPPTVPNTAATIFRALGAPGAPTVAAANPTTENPQDASSIASLSLNLSLTGGNSLAGLVLAPITALVNPLVNLISTTVLQGLISPLLNLLGVGVGNATVTMDTVVISRPAVTTECLPTAGSVRSCPAVSSLP
ncbi:MAG: pilus assembly protein TadG-related protein [Stenotrophobium sp.]